MSGLVKSVKKVFKKVGEGIKNVWHAIAPIAKVVVIAAAVYFTAGAAIGAFAGEGAIAALPGWGAGGLFSSAATSMGVPGFGGAATLFASGAGGAAAGAAGAEAAGAGAGAAGAASTAGAAGSATAAGTSAAGTAGTAAAGTGAATASPGLIGAISNAVEAHPMATMMAAQGVSKAVQASAEQQAKKDARQEARKATSWGLSKNGQNYADISSGELAAPASPQTQAVASPNMAPINNPGLINSAVQQRQQMAAQGQGIVGAVMQGYNGQPTGQATTGIPTLADLLARNPYMNPTRIV